MISEKEMVMVEMVMMVAMMIFATQRNGWQRHLAACGGRTLISLIAFALALFARALALSPASHKFLSFLADLAAASTLL